MPERDLAEPAFDFLARELDFAARVFPALDVAPRDFFVAAPLRTGFAFLRREDFAPPLAAGFAARLVFARVFTERTVFRTVRFAAGSTGLSLAAALPTAAPMAPPTIAPIGPPKAPSTAPVAAPAAGFEIGGISMFSREPEFSSEDSDSLVIRRLLGLVAIEGNTQISSRASTIGFVVPMRPGLLQMKKRLSFAQALSQILFSAL